MNLLVMAIYDLGHRPAKHREIFEMSKASYEQNLLGVDQIVVLEGQVLSRRKNRADRNRAYGQMLREVYEEVSHIWAEGNTVLKVDSDTLCMRPTSFPTGDDMRLFNLANAKVPYEAIPRESYLHSGVVYLPEEMDPTCWEIGAAAVDQWDDEQWAYDQLVWNLMFWHQVGYKYAKAKDYLDARYCYAPLSDFKNLGISSEQAYIMHFCETRGLLHVRSKMEKKARQAGIL